MSLAMSVGALAYKKAHDPEGYRLLRDQLKEVNRVLASKKLRPHKEPEKLPEMKSRSALAGQPYDWLHFLRRAVFCKKAFRKLTPLGPGKNPRPSALIREMLDLITSGFLVSHIISHSDSEGFYVPVDFPKPLYDHLPDEDNRCIPGGILGSSQAVMRELVMTAPLLGIALKGGKLSDADAASLSQEKEGKRFWIERKMWLQFFEMARLSIKHKTAIVFE